ncbi:hypothetical protein PAXINDRAFT_15787 [Paxillus involutus ATCC 200175]|uniref:Uncharacterized protein n=1 Tax=Paxillus involutus ATCC 200175 TaxID=664439 RepID=A0A0C9T6H6_PAXIN|nr:hypothetical protein PAXINDRAFT_15787 [Paxillus involutus ATCC 200175]
MPNQMSLQAVQALVVVVAAVIETTIGKVAQLQHAGQKSTDVWFKAIKIIDVQLVRIFFTWATLTFQIQVKVRATLIPGILVPPLVIATKVNIHTPAEILRTKLWPNLMALHFHEGIEAHPWARLHLTGRAHLTASTSSAGAGPSRKLTAPRKVKVKMVEANIEMGDSDPGDEDKDEDEGEQKATKGNGKEKTRVKEKRRGNMKVTLIDTGKETPKVCKQTDRLKVRSKETGRERKKGIVQEKDNATEMATDHTQGKGKRKGKKKEAVQEDSVMEMAMEKTKANVKAKGNGRAKQYVVETVQVEALLKAESLVPVQNAFSEKLSHTGFDFFVMLVVDLLHELELGVWKAIFIHLLCMLDSLNGNVLSKLDYRYRSVPTFGRSTIRHFRSNVSDMKKMAAQDFGDVLQCSIPVFGGLFPEPHDQEIMHLLFMLGHWHGLAKLRMHTDGTLGALDKVTKQHGCSLCKFVDETCPAFSTKELHREAESCKRRQGELEHCTSKKHFSRTSGTAFIPQLASIECHQTRICRIRTQRHAMNGDDPTPHEPMEHHTIGLSQNFPLDLPSFMQKNVGDPAAEDFIQKLKFHILPRLREIHSNLKSTSQELTPNLLVSSSYSDSPPSEAHGLLTSVIFKANRIYRHPLLHINYTTYDLHRETDVVNPSTDHRDIMLLAQPDSSGGSRSHRFCYAHILGIFHANIIYTGPESRDYQAQRLEFLWVHWFELVDQAARWENGRLDTIKFVPMHDPDAFRFINPADILRASHVIPALMSGRACSDGVTISINTHDGDDWNCYYINRFVDRDMVMRYYWGLGIRHMYASEHNQDEDQSSPEALNSTELGDHVIAGEESTQPSKFDASASDDSDEPDLESELGNGYSDDDMLDPEALYESNGGVDDTESGRYKY